MFWFRSYRRVKAYGDGTHFYRSAYLSTMMGNTASDSVNVTEYIPVAQRVFGLLDSEKKNGFGLGSFYQTLYKSIT